MPATVRKSWRGVADAVGLLLNRAERSVPVFTAEPPDRA